MGWRMRARAAAAWCLWRLYDACWSAGDRLEAWGQGCRTLAIGIICGPMKHVMPVPAQPIAYAVTEPPAPIEPGPSEPSRTSPIIQAPTDVDQALASVSAIPAPGFEPVAEFRLPGRGKVVH